jgi:hypothetical protein
MPQVTPFPTLSTETTPMQQMVIANRLADGFVVFLGASDAWHRRIGDGRVLQGEAEAEAALEVAKRHEAENVVVEPTLIEVTVDEAGEPHPVEIREAIRAFGPTIGGATGGQDHPDPVGPEAGRR